MQRRKETTPTWLKYTRISFVIITVILTVLVTVNFAYNSLRIESVEQFEAILNGVSKNEINYIKLSKLLLAAKYYDSNILSNFKPMITEVNK